VMKKKLANKIMTKPTIDNESSEEEVERRHRDNNSQKIGTDRALLGKSTEENSHKPQIGSDKITNSTVKGPTNPMDVMMLISEDESDGDSKQKRKAGSLDKLNTKKLKKT
jgi:hypothetical protein